MKSSKPYHLLFILFLFIPFASALSQAVPKSLAAKRTTANFKIDGNLDEPAWKEATPATDFIEWRPNFGAPEDPACKTEIYLLYDNTSVYIGGYCHERKKDSISKELAGRDQVGVNDYVGVMFDTYRDNINGVGFYVTPLGEQFDAKYSNSSNNIEDPTWNAVWESNAKIVADGWTFEMRIPYSALRFVSKDDQSWGLNITRNRKKANKQYFWNPVDPKVNGLLNQEGYWTGIEKIKAPVRLSFSPYFSTYLNHYPYHLDGIKDWTSSVNGGMDVKYGVNDAFTVDMTLIPDFGQVQSDNHVLNLSPFEVKYQENRPFFTEGTELFNKGNLFYSRRIGGVPLHFGDVYNEVGPNETVVTDPLESKLINATKFSGRTKEKLGIGVFNAITQPMYASIEDTLTGATRKILSGPLTNYNIMVVDQSLKNNSAISFVNTNVWRSGKDYDANVSAAILNFNNKKNSYNWNGEFSLSQLMMSPKNVNGYMHNVGVAKTGGNWNFQLFEELFDDKYSKNDLGLQFTNNYLDHGLWTAYRWQKPTHWYNRIQVNYNAYFSLLYKKFPGQLIDSKFQLFQTNVNANIQFKNNWWAGMFVGYVTKGHDFYEPRTTGYSFRSPQRIQFNPWIQTNQTKKYYLSFNYFIGIRSLFNSPNPDITIQQSYRFSDKFSISHKLDYNPTRNDAGFYEQYYETDPSGNQVLKDIIFSRRDRKTVDNTVGFKYSLNNRSGITLRIRHYWSKVDIKQLYDLQKDGSLLPTKYNTIQVPINNENLNLLNVDAVYTWEFAPGSFINIVWKENTQLSDVLIQYGYLKNFNNTIAGPQNNNLSLKIIYYLDYLKFKNWKKKTAFFGQKKKADYSFNRQGRIDPLSF